MGDAWKAWERQVGASISRWLSFGASKDLLCRQSLMGRMVECKYGDLAIHPSCPPSWMVQAQWFMETFMVDAKNRKAFRLAALLTQPANQFWEWWAKHTKQAAEAGGKKRMMVMQHGGAHVLVWGKREVDWMMPTIGDKWPFPAYQVQRRWDTEEEECLVFCQFENWLKFADPVTLGCPKHLQKGAM